MAPITLVRLYRTLFGLLALSALVTEVATLHERGTLRLGNFASYFTVESMPTLLWLAFPLAYVVYSLIRGHSSHWYPYPFLDPGPRGYTGVIQSSIGIAISAAVLVFVLTLVTGSGSLRELIRARSADGHRTDRP
jgi:hypothetical protein